MQYEDGADRAQLAAHEVNIEHVAGYQLDAGRHATRPKLRAQCAHLGAAPGQFLDDEGTNLARSADCQDCHAIAPLAVTTID